MAVNILAYTFLCIYVHNSLELEPRSGIAGMVSTLKMSIDNQLPSGYPFLPVLIEGRDPTGHIYFEPDYVLLTFCQFDGVKGTSIYR